MVWISGNITITMVCYSIWRPRIEIKNLLLVYKFLQKTVTKLISLLKSLQIFMRLNTFLIIFSIEKGKKQGKENHKKMRVIQTTNLGTYEWRCPICLDLCHLQMQHLHTLYTNQIKSVKKTNLNKFNSNLCTSKIHVNRRCVWYAAHVSVRH